MQAEARAIRIGQKKTVFVVSLLTVGTIEERIDILLRRKRELFREVVDGLSDEKLSSVLSEEELFSLFDIKKGERTTPRTGATIESLKRISPRQFEKLVADLYGKMGYHVRLTLGCPHFAQENGRGLSKKGGN